MSDRSSNADSHVLGVIEKTNSEYKLAGSRFPSSFEAGADVAQLG